MIQLVAKRPLLFPRALIELLAALRTQLRFRVLLVVQGVGLRKCLLGLFFTSQLAQYKPKLIRDARIFRSNLLRLLQPLFRVGQISLLEVRESEVIGRIRQRWLVGVLVQRLARPSDLALANIEPSQVVQPVGMLFGL